jgi:hypothetical protein
MNNLTKSRKICKNIEMTGNKYRARVYKNGQYFELYESKLNLAQHWVNSIKSGNFRVITK